MALALRSLFLLCGLTGLLTGVGSFPSRFFNDVSCPEGWTQVDLKCYILEDDARMFQDAEAVCNILGGNMVSISNDLENIVVGAIGENGVSGATMWIGLFDNIKVECQTGGAATLKKPLDASPRRQINSSSSAELFVHAPCRISTPDF
nr:galactose-specific lectin nattectin-like [Nerophis lumbriciformis]